MPKNSQKFALPVGYVKHKQVFKLSISQILFGLGDSAFSNELSCGPGKSRTIQLHHPEF